MFHLHLAAEELTKPSPIAEFLTWLLGSSRWGIGRMTLITLGFGVVVTLVLFLISKVPLSYNLNNLRVRWKNTGLTALAFTLVLSVLTLMLAFVEWPPRERDRTFRRNHRRRVQQSVQRGCRRYREPTRSDARR